MAETGEELRHLQCPTITLIRKDLKPEDQRDQDQQGGGFQRDSFPGEKEEGHADEQQDSE